MNREIVMGFIPWDFFSSEEFKPSSLRKAAYASLADICIPT